MRYLIILFCLVLPACVSTAHRDYGNKLQFNDEPINGLREVAELDSQGIILLRVEYSGGNGKKITKPLSVQFRTGAQREASLSSMLLGRLGRFDSEQFDYHSKDNQFLAVILAPGKYWYDSAHIGGYSSRYTPTKLIEFNVEAGKAKYIGDLKLYFNKDDFVKEKTLFGSTVNKRKSDIIDYRFRVENDEKAAEQFYSAIPNKPNWPLVIEPMTVQPRQITYYTTEECNSFWHTYSTSRGHCLER